ncbi:MAG: hypothetical protein Q7J16_06860 [Candidatus Cloacimonadales bacterium]|nr:hypothetical protein [Candidatus Cloacimonadales bacterium]
MKKKINKKINKKPGDLELKLLAYIQMTNAKTISTGDVVKVLGITKQRENTLFSVMNKKGMILRITTGYYLIPDKISPTSNALIDGMEILFYLMNYYDAKYIISGPTAIYYYGFTTQIPNRIYVYNDKICGDKQISNNAFVFMQTSIKRLKGAKTISTNKGLKIPFASKSRLLIDCIYDWNRYNTIPKVFTWIRKEISQDPKVTSNLISDAIRYGNKAVIARLGYCLDQIGIEQGELNRLRKKIAESKSIIPLIPDTDLKGSVNKKWGLIINGQI